MKKIILVDKRDCRVSFIIIIDFRKWKGIKMQLERCSSPVAQRGSNAQCNAGGDLSSVPGSGRSPREGYGNPLQSSCLENPTDRGAWQATVLGVAKSQTRLSMMHKDKFTERC